MNGKIQNMCIMLLYVDVASHDVATLKVLNITFSASLQLT